MAGILVAFLYECYCGATWDRVWEGVSLEDVGSRDSDCPMCGIEAHPEGWHQLTPGEVHHWRVTGDFSPGVAMPGSRPGDVYLYRLYGAGDLLLYVGITSDPERRERAHRREDPWAHLIDRMEVGERYTSRAHAEEGKREAQRDEHPMFLWCSVKGQRRSEQLWFDASPLRMQ